MVDFTPQIDFAPDTQIPAPVNTKPLEDHFHAELTKAVDANKDADGTAKPFTFTDALKAGWQQSITGLAQRQAMPDTILPEDAPWYQSISSKLSTVVGDLPAMAAGTFIGTAAGLETGPGAVITGMGGAMALPPGMRRVMMDGYKNGDFKTPQEFLSLAAATFLDTAKGYITGAAGGAAGVGAGVALEASSPLVQSAVVQGAQLTTMVNVGAGLEGHLASRQDYLDGAALMFGLHAAGLGAEKLSDIFVKTGIQPKQVIMDSIKDPTLKSDLLSQLPIPRAYQDQVDPSFKEQPEPTIAGVPALPEDASELDKANAYNASKIKSSVEPKKEYKSFDELYAQNVDNLDPVKQIQEAIQKRDNGEPLPAGEDPYKLLRVTRGGYERANQFIKYGTVDFKTLAQNGESMADIIEPVRKDLTNFKSYIAARRAVELEGRGINSGFDLEKQNTILNDTPAATKAIYEDSAKRLTDYNNRVTAYARDGGLISEEDYKNFVEMNKMFTPFHRVLPDADNLGGTPPGMKTAKPFKAIKGSDKDIIDPIETTIKNTYALLSLAERNNATQKMIENAVKNDFTKPGHNGGPPLFEKQAQRVEAINVTNEELSKHISAGGQNETVVGSGQTLPAAQGSAGLEGTKVTFNPENLGDLPVFRAMWEPLADNQIAFFDKGKRQVYNVNNDPELVKIFKSNPSIMNDTFFKFITKFSTAYRTGTILNTTFPPLHMARQNINAFVNGTTDGDVMLPVVSLIQGVAGMLGEKGAERYQQFRSSGGLNSNITEWDNRYIQKSINGMEEGGKTEKLMSWIENAKNDPKSLVTLPYNVVRHPLDAAQLMAKVYMDGVHGAIAAHDNALRFAKFNKVMDRMEADGVMGRDAVIEAGYQSREVLLDNFRRGSNIAAVNALIPFTNLRIQGLSKLAQMAKEDPTGFALRAGAGIVMPSVYLWYANRNDPRHKEKQDWQRDNFWSVYTNDWREPKAGDTIPNMKGLIGTRGDGSGLENRFSDGGKVGQYNFGSEYQLSKPPETGLIFGSTIERFLDFADAKYTEEKLAGYRAILDDPKTSASDRAATVKAAAELQDNAQFQPDHPAMALLKSFGNILPGEMITAQNPVYEMFSNKSNFTGGPIVTSAAERLLPAAQQTEYTTELAKAMGGLIGALPGMDRSKLASPPMIENFIRQWTGGMGMKVLKYASQALSNAGVLPNPTKPTPSLADNPFIGGFIARFPTASTKSISDFYDQYDYASQSFATLQYYASKGNVSAVRFLSSTAAAQSFQSLAGVRQTLSGVQKSIQMISENPTMPADQKRQLIDTQYYYAISMAQQGNTMLKSIAAQLKGNEPNIPEQPFFRGQRKQ